MESKHTGANKKKPERRYIVKVVFDGETYRASHYNFMAIDARQAKVKAKHYLALHSLYPGGYTLEAFVDKSSNLSELERAAIAKAEAK